MAIGTITIPSVQGDMPLTLEAGKSTVFIGANGAGKTRLGVMIESRFQGQAEVHRIAAHRSLQMNTAVQPPQFGSRPKSVEVRLPRRWRRPQTRASLAVEPRDCHAVGL